MNKISDLIERGLISDLNGLAGATGTKIIWQHQNESVKEKLEALLAV